MTSAQAEAPWRDASRGLDERVEDLLARMTLRERSTAWRVAEAVAVAREAQVCVLALGDVAGPFGRGTSGEGCDVPDLRLPGPQEQLLEALLATGTPVVLVLLSGRPYALGGQADRLAAIVQAFFPGEEGGPAVAGGPRGPRVPVGPPSRQHAAVGGRPPRAPSGPRHASEHSGPHAAVPVRARPVLHQLRVVDDHRRMFARVVNSPQRSGIS